LQLTTAQNDQSNFKEAAEVLPALNPAAPRNDPSAAKKALTQKITRFLLELPVMLRSPFSHPLEACHVDFALFATHHLPFEPTFPDGWATRGIMRRFFWFLPSCRRFGKPAVGLLWGDCPVMSQFEFFAASEIKCHSAPIAAP